MRVIMTTIFKFHELSPDAQTRALKHLIDSGMLPEEIGQRFAQGETRDTLCQDARQCSENGQIDQEWNRQGDPYPDDFMEDCSAEILPEGD
jgi:hypothetical protein